MFWLFPSWTPSCRIHWTNASNLLLHSFNSPLSYASFMRIPSPSVCRAMSQWTKLPKLPIYFFVFLEYFTHPISIHFPDNWFSGNGNAVDNLFELIQSTIFLWPSTYLPSSSEITCAGFEWYIHHSSIPIHFLIYFFPNALSVT